jgi:hypothetical protein
VGDRRSGIVQVAFDLSHQAEPEARLHLIQGLTTGQLRALASSMALPAPEPAGECVPSRADLAWRIAYHLVDTGEASWMAVLRALDCGWALTRRVARRDAPDGAYLWRDDTQGRGPYVPESIILGLQACGALRAPLGADLPPTGLFPTEPQIPAMRLIQTQIDPVAAANSPAAAAQLQLAPQAALQLENLTQDDAELAGAVEVWRAGSPNSQEAAQALAALVCARAGLERCMACQQIRAPLPCIHSCLGDLTDSGRAAVRAYDCWYAGAAAVGA